MLCQALSHCILLILVTSVGSLNYGSGPVWHCTSTYLGNLATVNCYLVLGTVVVERTHLLGAMQIGALSMTGQ